MLPVGGTAVSADPFRAVADPTRRAILDMLHGSDRTVVELARPFRMSRPAISQHLRVLRDAGLVSALRKGRLRRYRLNPAPMQAMCDWMAKYKRVTDLTGAIAAPVADSVPGFAV